MKQRIALVLGIVGKIAIVAILAATTSCATVTVKVTADGKYNRKIVRVRTTRHSIDSTTVTINKSFQVK